MYAVFQSGGKQYLAREGHIIRLEKINTKIGKIIKFDKVLMITNHKETKIGSPFVQGSLINAEILIHSRKEKIKIIKFRRRKHFRKIQGHRQWFTEVKILSITFKKFEDKINGT